VPSCTTGVSAARTPILIGVYDFYAEAKEYHDPKQLDIVDLVTKPASTEHDVKLNIARYSVLGSCPTRVGAAVTCPKSDSADQ
jgi:hypothetical protein